MVCAVSALPQNLLQNGPQDQAPVRAPGPVLTAIEPILDFMSDGILVIRADRSIAYANDAFLRLWRVPAEMMSYRNDFAILNHVLSQLSDPTQFVGEIERLYQSDEVSSDELNFKDGRLFGRRSLPFEIGDAQAARVWIFTDITPDIEPAPAQDTARSDRKDGPAGLLRRLSRQMAGK